MCWHIDKPHLCAERLRSEMCVAKFAGLSAVATSKHLFTLPLQPALIPRAAPRRSQYRSLGRAGVAHSPPDVRGKSLSHCGGRRGQNASGSKVEKQENVRLIRDESFIWGFMSLCSSLTLFWKFWIEVWRMTQHFPESIPWMRNEMIEACPTVWLFLPVTL